MTAEIKLRQASILHITNSSSEFEHPYGNQEDDVWGKPVAQLIPLMQAKTDREVVRLQEEIAIESSAPELVLTKRIMIELIPLFNQMAAAQFMKYHPDAEPQSWEDYDPEVCRQIRVCLAKNIDALGETNEPLRETLQIIKDELLPVKDGDEERLQMVSRHLEAQNHLCLEQGTPALVLLYDNIWSPWPL